MLMVPLLAVTLSFGQNRPDKDKIKSLKIAFITERLDLSTKEAQTFWPIYNEYEEKGRRCAKKNVGKYVIK